MPVLVDIARLAACHADGPQADVHAVSGAALVWEGDRIVWAGAEADLPDAYAGWPRESAGGALVIPGLVDCHTHLPFGGWRADEFAERLAGTSYADIARRGGGILSTRAATQAATEDELADRVVSFLNEMVALGVTTAEAKSGYGLTLADELKQLRAIRTADERHAARLVPTLLAAHTVPAEHKANRAGYVRLVCDEIIPAVAEEKLARFCDVFVEETAFSLGEAREVLETGRRHGLVPKLHADQLTSGGGAELAAELQAASADHLEHTAEAGIQAMADAGVVAVSLPLASLYLNEPPMDARRWMEAGCAVAVATDFNPGSAPSYHLPMAMTLACTMQRMTPAEALKAATIVAARAIGVEDEVGSLEPGKRADFAVIDAPDEAHWLYHLRPNACVRTVAGGKTVWQAPRS
jgi:imidazolonepropionase